MAMAVATVMAGQRADEWWDGDDVLMTMISLTATKMTINKKYDEGGWMGSSSPLRCCSGESAENRRKQVPTITFNLINGSTYEGEKAVVRQPALIGGSGQ
jgi:hypothetical protein